MTRALSVVLLAFAFAAPVAAQAPQGVMMRVDRSTNPQDPDDVPEVTITAVGDGFQVNTGPVLGAHQDTRRVFPHEVQGWVHGTGGGMHSGIATQHVAWTALTTYMRLTDRLR